MCLRIVEILQAVFQTTQEDVGAGQLLHGFHGHQTACGERIEHLQGRAHAQTRVAPTADQLENLRNEFDFANAARPQLDVVGHFAACHFATNLRVQAAHGVDGAEVEVFAEYE